MSAHDDFEVRNNEFWNAALCWLRSRLRGENPPDLIAPPASALFMLAERFRLSSFEQSVMLLCAAMELDPGMGDLCAEVQGRPDRPFPTFSLAVSRFAEPSWDSVTPHGPLRYWHLIDVHRPAAEPVIHACLTADERIVHYLKGINAVDDRLLPFLLPPLPPVTRFSAAQERTLADIVRLAPHAPMFQLSGPEAECTRIARGAADRLGLPMLRLQVDALPGDAAELETLIRLWQREMILAPAALCLHGQALEPAAAGPLRRFLAALRTPTFVIGAQRIALGPDVNSLEIDKPTPQEQAALWRDLAGERTASWAGHFHLGFDAIENIVAGLDDGGDGWQACLLHTAPRFGRLAQHIEPKATWDDLVLPPPERELLKQLVLEVRHRPCVLDQWGFRARTSRGLGVHALFVGESGTGKSLAAEVIARELDLHLARIDLSAVVDKYIGETEKNLGRIFDAADDGGVLLFFDEADALFGKRTEVKDSHDRYANIEINYLLQRMESYRGLAILATNMKSALDNAFLRRLRFLITFPFPGPAERKLLWQKIFPAETPTEGLDYDRLACLNLTGGSIHNIALSAALRAAEARSAVTMPLVLEAARAEFRKIDRPVSEVDLLWPKPNG